VIVLPLVAGGTRLGLLAVADRANRAPSAETIEFLELLALQVAAALPRETTSPLESLPERAGVVIVDAAHATDVEAALRAVAWSGGTTYQTSETEFVVALTPDRATCAQAVGAELRALLGVPVGVAVGVVGEPGAALLDRARGALI
jgi:hypothetical protein